MRKSARSSTWVEQRAEVAQVDAAVGGQQELRQGELALAEDAEGADHRLALVALAHDARRRASGSRSRRSSRGSRPPASRPGRAARAALAGSRRGRSPPGAACRPPSPGRSRPCGARARRPRTPGSRGPRSSSRSGRRTGPRGGARAAARVRRGRTRRWRRAAAARTGCTARGRRSCPSRLASSTSGTFSGSGATAARISAGGPPTCTLTGRSTPAASASARWKPPPLPICTCRPAGRRRTPACGTCRGSRPRSSGDGWSRAAASRSGRRRAARSGSPGGARAAAGARPRRRPVRCARVRVPMPPRRARRPRFFHSLPSVGGTSSWGRRAASATSSSGQRPKARSTRPAVPKRFVTTGKRGPAHAAEDERRTARGDHAAVDLGQLELGIDLDFHLAHLSRSA